MLRRSLPRSLPAGAVGVVKMRWQSRSPADRCWWPLPPAVCRGKAGYTLLEVMVAVAIIAIALTALLGSQGQSVSLAGEAQLATTAPLLAQAKMAELAVSGEERGGVSVGEGDFGDDFPGYRWMVTRRDLSADVAADCREFLQGVDVVVTWGTPVRYRYQLTSSLFVAPE